MPPATPLRRNFGKKTAKSNSNFVLNERVREGMRDPVQSGLKFAVISREKVMIRRFVSGTGDALHLHQHVHLDPD